MPDWQPGGEQSRARLPDREGFVERDGVRTFYEVYGEGEPSILFVPGWSIVHSRLWKLQLPYFARHGRAITFDPRGNGRSDRPTDPVAHADAEIVADMLAVLDATSTERAWVVGMSRGCPRALLFASQHPERTHGVAFISPGVATTEEQAKGWAGRIAQHALAPELVPEDERWAWRYLNFAAWERDPSAYGRFVVDFMEQFFPEPHSTKCIEDAIGWALETDGPSMRAALLGPPIGRPEEVRRMCDGLACPSLVIHGDRDAVTPFELGLDLAARLGTRLEVVKGSGHGPETRKPVQVNLALRELVDPAFERKVSVPQRSRGPKRALFISSPIGLGHTQRDVAIARELRAVHPDLQIDWLAQHPVTRVLEAEGEAIHPASRHLASESAHIECESAEHDLHCFQAIRRMDEILVANFMLFHDIVREGSYDLVVGDEAWEVDYYLHENPAEKRAPYVWLTDFVGWLPMPDGGDHEAFLTRDYNAEMIEHIASQPQVRDRAIFVGNPDDIVPERFGHDLPMIREWTEQNFDFAGYVTGFDPAGLGDRTALRHELGYRDDERVCIVSVGGSGVGGHLLRKVMAAYPEAKRREPGLRMIVVAGPRIDPASLPAAPDLEVVPFVHNLYRHFAACDLAVVQGGLTTSMELTASRRPFLYFPLRHHFEQNHHVRHRLERYGAGRCMDFDAATPDVVAETIAGEIGREVAYQPVETNGARRAAELIAELL